MSKILINNLECSFEGVEYTLLANFKPTPRTWLIAWKTSQGNLDTARDILLLQMCHVSYMLEGLEMQPVECSTDQRARHILLLEHPHRALIESLEHWLCRTTRPSDFLMKCPYRVALNDFKEKERQKHVDDEYEILSEVNRARCRAAQARQEVSQ